MSLSNLEEYLEAFEGAHQESGLVPIAGFLPPRQHPQFNEIAVELIRCAMELSWHDPEHLELDDYRRQYPEIFEHSQNLDHVAFEEFRQRVLAGELVQAADYEKRYGIKTGHWPDLNEKDDSREIETKKLSTLATHVSSEADSSHKSLADSFQTAEGRLELSTLQNRLHGRLRFISLTFSLLLAYLALLVLINPSEKVGLFLGSSFLVTLNAACLAAIVTIAGWLWFRRSVALGTLRILESCLFGLMLLEVSAGLYSDLFIDHELREPLADDHSLFHYSSSWCLPFFALIVSYGILVPSTWRRCTLNVSAIAVTPIVICTLAASMENGLNQSFFQSFLLQMAIWMALAAAIAIYGVRRMEELERRFIESGKLGKYRILRQLAEGGMGSIYLAENTLLQRECAVKLVRKSEANDARMLERFEREVRVMASIAHPNIVQIFDFGHLSGGVFYYVMEYLRGPTLEDLVHQHGQLECRLVVQVLQNVCAALKPVHENDLVHRDIKPNNIMASQANDLSTFKLLDFGLVKTTVLNAPESQLTRQGAILGTPEFMSPEQAASETLDGRSDIYSLGAVAWYLLIGKPPFSKNTVIETLSAHIHESPRDVKEIRPEIPLHLANLVTRCLAKDPVDRFQDADELEQALTNLTSLNSVSKPIKSQ